MVQVFRKTLIAPEAFFNEPSVMGCGQLDLLGISLHRPQPLATPAVELGSGGRILFMDKNLAGKIPDLLSVSAVSMREMRNILMTSPICCEIKGAIKEDIRGYTTRMNEALKRTLHIKAVSKIAEAAHKHLSAPRATMPTLSC